MNLIVVRRTKNGWIITDTTGWMTGGQIDLCYVVEGFNPIKLANILTKLLHEKNTIKAQDPHAAHPARNSKVKKAIRRVKGDLLPNKPKVHDA